MPTKTPKCYLLLKRGLYWRLKSQGYTAIKAEAERYTFEEVRAYKAHIIRDTAKARTDDRDHVFAITETLCPRYLATIPSAAVARHASEAVGVLEAENARMWEMLADIRRRAMYGPALTPVDLLGMTDLASVIQAKALPERADG